MSSKKKGSKPPPKRQGSMATARKGTVTVNSAPTKSLVPAAVTVGEVRKGLGQFELRRKSSGADVDSIYQLTYKRSIGFPANTTNGTYGAFSVGLWGESGGSRYTLPLDISFSATANDVGVLLGACFSKWRPNSVRVDYCPSSPTSTAGNLAYAIVDASRTFNATKTAISSSDLATYGLDWRGCISAEHSVASPVWCPSSVVRRRNPEDTTWFSTVGAIAPPAGSSATLTDASVRSWSLICANVGAGTSNAFGDFIVTTECELKDMALCNVSMSVSSYGAGMSVGSDGRNFLSQGLRDSFSRDYAPKSAFDVKDVKTKPSVVTDVNIVQVSGTNLSSLATGLLPGALPVSLMAVNQDGKTASVLNSVHDATYDRDSLAVRDFGGVFPSGSSNASTLCTADKGKDLSDKPKAPPTNKEVDVKEKIPDPPSLVRQSAYVKETTIDCGVCKFPIPVGEMDAHIRNSKDHCLITCSASLKGEQCSHQRVSRTKLNEEYVMVNQRDPDPARPRTR